MPKKGREKDNVQTPRQKKADTANMPQVWLPDQVQLYLAKTLSLTHTPTVSLSLQPGPEGSEGYPCLPSNPQDSGPPTDEEQKRMAQLWAEEEQLVSPFTSLEQLYILNVLCILLSTAKRYYCSLVYLCECCIKYRNLMDTNVIAILHSTQISLYHKIC